MDSDNNKRFRDDGRSLYDFADEFLVVCPQCSRRAMVIPLANGLKDVWSARRLLCSSCGHSKDRVVNSFIVHPDQDWYFGLPLWLNTTCCGGELWAFNARHLAWLEGYVRATLREQRRDPKHGWSNQSALNRLPAWIKSGKHREDVLQGIEKLKDRLR